MPTRRARWPAGPLDRVRATLHAMHFRGPFTGLSAVGNITRARAVTSARPAGGRKNANRAAGKKVVDSACALH